MSQPNVVPFDPARRGGLARRGAPDKNGSADEYVWMECPGCASELRLAARWLEGVDEILCGRCAANVAGAP